MPKTRDVISPAERSCAVWMSSTTPCGRPIHPAPEHDENPVCLMHSKDPAKSNETFQIEIERILKNAERMESEADFNGFVFPGSKYSKRTFVPICNFEDAIFIHEAQFHESTFISRANFHSAEFSDNAYFAGTRFADDADFSNAKFTQDANFSGAKFAQKADFNDTKFTQNAMFTLAQFFLSTNFSAARFAKAAIFYMARFTQEEEFNSNRSIPKTRPHRIIAPNRADFSNAIFAGDTNFNKSRFTQIADFSNVTFTQETVFGNTTFLRGINLTHAKVGGTMKFHETRFGNTFPHEIGLNFSYVTIESPEHVKFYKNDLGQALFYNTDVSDIDFTLVTWRIRIARTWMERWRLLARTSWQPVPRFHLYEEDVTLGESRDTKGPYQDLQPPKKCSDERNFALISVTYQQLKRNYDSKGDYWMAGHFHYGEMEMKRLHSRWKFPFLRWLDHHISLVALYKYASSYGESYVLPLAWLAMVLAIFAVLYPAVGIDLNIPDASKSGDTLMGYWNYSSFFRSHWNEHPSGFFGMMVHGLMTSLSVAGFQRELRYAPSYPWGRLLALFELLLTTSLGGLFALAIRRQFKRS